VRTTKLLPLILAAACGGSKKPDTTASAPPPAPSPPVTQAPPADPDAALVAEAKQFVAGLDAKIRPVMVDASVAEWTNETDITKEHEAATAKAAETSSVEITKLVKYARKFEPVMGKLDADTRRQLVLLQFQAQPSPDDPAQASELAKIAAEMTSIYGKGVCKTDRNGKETCRDIDYWSKLLQKEHNPQKLLAAWKTWHDAVGHAEGPLFAKYVELANAGAKGIGFTDVAQMWQASYDMPPEQFEAEVDRLWGQVKPLYDQLHCYARRQLNKTYGDKIVPKTGPIPHTCSATCGRRTGATSTTSSSRTRASRRSTSRPSSRRATTRRRWCRWARPSTPRSAWIRYRRRSGRGAS
jgi:peptidyl-dipeptidase A